MNRGRSTSISARVRRCLGAGLVALGVVVAAIGGVLFGSGVAGASLTFGTADGSGNYADCALATSVTSGLVYVSANCNTVWTATDCPVGWSGCVLILEFLGGDNSTDYYDDLGTNASIGSDGTDAWSETDIGSCNNEGLYNGPQCGQVGTASDWQCFLLNNAVWGSGSGGVPLHLRDYAL